VGQSVRLSERLRGHRWVIGPNGVRAEKGRFFEGAYVKVRSYRRFGEWLMAEARLIRRLRPVLNARGFRRALDPAKEPRLGADGSYTFDIQLTGKMGFTPPPSRDIRRCICGLALDLTRGSAACPCGRSLSVAQGRIRPSCPHPQTGESR
jgi:hypothetical protein